VLIEWACCLFSGFNGPTLTGTLPAAWSALAPVLTNMYAQQVPVHVCNCEEWAVHWHPASLALSPILAEPCHSKETQWRSQGDCLWSGVHSPISKYCTTPLFGNTSASAPISLIFLEKLWYIHFTYSSSYTFCRSVRSPGTVRSASITGALPTEWEAMGSLQTL
jgi:hypothetical protein